MNENKKHNPFLTIISILFFIFMVVYFLGVSGYYENKLHLKTTYTEEKIREFEEDVKSGKEIDLKKYVNDEHKDYSNVFTNISDYIGGFASKIMGGGIDESWKIIKVLFG